MTPPFQPDPTVCNLGDIVDPAAPDDRAWLVDVREDDSHEIWTYGRLRRDADAVARALAKRGLARGAAVGILSANRPEFLVAYFGIMRAGLCAVPINHKLPPETVRHIAADSAIRLIYADGERMALVPDGVPAVSFDDPGPAGYAASLDPGPWRPVEMGPDDAANVLYTSGSTGMPKGVPLMHLAYVWMCGQYETLRPVVGGRPAIVAAPLFHMNALFFSKVLVRLGGTNVLMRRFTAAGFIRAIARHRVVMITSVPTMLALVVREAEELARADLSCVEYVYTGSAPLTQALADKIKAAFPGAAFQNGWGTTEAGPTGFGPHPEGKPRPDTAIGYPLPFCEVRLVDGPDDNQGTLLIRTPTTMPGYLNLPEQNARRLRDGWYDTGDVMRRDADGFFHFVGRADDMFVCGGENIYPGEVEKMLDRHEDVHQSLVVPVADEIKGQKPVAFVVPKPGRTPDEAALKAYALANGPAYAHPRRVILIDQMPLAGTNKIDRKALLQRAFAMFPSGLDGG